MIAASARRLLQAGLATRGYALREADLPPRDFAAFLKAFRATGVSPRTLIDIGVGPGTDWLYDAFPAAELVLFEPLRMFAPQIEALQARRSARVHWCALSDSDGEMVLNVPDNSPTGSSLLAVDPAWENVQRKVGRTGYSQHRVPVRRLDDALAGVEGPYVVKVDAEGADLAVLRGGPRVVAGADLVIVECSVTPRLVGGSDYIDVAAHMREAGFVLVDIIDFASFGRPRVLAYIDMAFAPVGGAFLSRATG